MTRNYVVVHFNDGRVKIWRDYGEAWGSPIYTVVGYADSHKAAQALVKEYRQQFTVMARERQAALKAFDAEFLDNPA